MNQRTSLILISTTNAKSQRQEQLQKLIASVRKIAVDRPFNIKLYILAQQDTGQYVSVSDNFVHITPIPGQISLSAARNMLLRNLNMKDTLQSDDVVAFPDDDCWYPDGTLDYVFDKFESDKRLDFWFCRYSSSPESPSAASKSPALQSVISFASSNTIFVRGSILLNDFIFDERLGIGTPMNGGEDTDFALRAFSVARKTCFLNQPVVGHRDYDKKLRSKYFAGSFIAIIRHAPLNFSGYTARFRKILVGCYLLVRQELKIPVIFEALRLIVKG